MYGGMEILVSQLSIPALHYSIFCYANSHLWIGTFGRGGCFILILGSGRPGFRAAYWDGHPTGSAPGVHAWPQVVSKRSSCLCVQISLPLLIKLPV